jgi:segregation and condensation protein B
MKTKKKPANNIVKFPKNLNKLERQVEAILFAADEPLDIETIEKRVQSTNSIKKILINLQSDYSLRGINLVCIKDKWSFRTSKDLVNLMSLQKSTEKKLSKATLETLAIIVYHQPVTRSEIEEIRGVAFGTNTIETLLELEWVKPAGRKDIIGKPIQYVTTDTFLHHFNIQRLTDLPDVDELSSAGLIDTATIDASIFGTGKFYKEQSQNKKEDIYYNIEKAIDETPNKD